jgi:hypothetical protein
LVGDDGIFGDRLTALQPEDVGRNIYIYIYIYIYSCSVIGKENRAEIFNFMGDQSWAVLFKLMPKLLLESVGGI